MIEDHTNPPTPIGWIITNGGDAGSPLAMTWIFPYGVSTKNVSRGTGQCRRASS
jgi:hypothetical protein